MSDSFSKKEKEKRKQQKKKEKEQRKSERKDQDKGSSLEDMMAYVDEDGNITSTPPDPTKKRKEIDVESILIGATAVERDETPSLHTGRITSFNTSKGYGFIKDQKTQQSIFVHVSALLEPVEEGSLVTFEIEQGERGPAAKGVKLA